MLCDKLVKCGFRYHSDIREMSTCNRFCIFTNLCRYRLKTMRAAAVQECSDLPQILAGQTYAVIHQ